MVTKAPDPYDDRPLRSTESTWSVQAGAAGTSELNYGQIHELIHRDISLGNAFRTERIKLMIALASGVFALTVTFHKDLFHEATGPDSLPLLMGGWLVLLASLLVGILHLKHWEDFYLEHRVLGKAVWRVHTATTAADQNSARIAYLQAKKKIDGFQESYRWANIAQTGALLLGLVLIVAYVAYSASRPPAPPKADDKTCCCAACASPPAKSADSSGTPAAR